MSWVRWGDGSDLYIYDDYGGFTRCCLCKLEKGGRVNVDISDQNERAVYEHIQKHIDAGHVVPDWLEESTKEFLESTDDAAQSEI